MVLISLNSLRKHKNVAKFVLIDDIVWRIRIIKYNRLGLMILKYSFRIISYKVDTKLIRLRIRFIDYCLDHGATTHWFYGPILRWYLRLVKVLDNVK